MKAIVLAAGRGSRLRPLTDTCPKPMVPIAGRPLLEHVLLLLRHHGFTQIAINLHHLPDVVRDHFGDGSAWDLELTYSPEESLLGTAGAVRQLTWFLDEPFLVYYGDHLTNFDLATFWQYHVAGAGITTVGLFEQAETTASGIVDLGADGSIRRFVEKPDPDQVFANYLVNAGIYACNPAIVDWIGAGAPQDFGHDVFPLLLRENQRLLGYHLSGQLLGTDTPERYRHALAQVESGTFELATARP